MVKLLLRMLLVWMLYGLAACSFDAAQAPPVGTPRPTARSVARAAQTEHSLPGRLLYVRDGQIWLHQGTDARPLNLEGRVRDPAWSSDGTRIAYIRREESFADLYIFNVETGRTSQVTFNDSSLQPRSQEYVHQVVWAAKPTWSPDDEEIVFLSQLRPATGPDDQPAIYEYPLALYRYRTDLIGTRQPTNDDLLGVEQAESDALSPAWSPDGRHLAYVQAPRGSAPRQIMLYNFDTEELRQFPGTPDGAYDPAWSPDGSRLAFVVAQEGATDVWIVDGPAGSGAAQRITKLGRSRLPAWGPDGQSIAFVNVGDTSSDVFHIDLRQEEGQLAAGEPIAVTRGAQVDATAGMSWTR